jgi:hypothetical protein
MIWSKRGAALANSSTKALAEPMVTNVFHKQPACCNERACARLGFIEKIVAGHSGSQIAVIAHSGTLRAIVRILLGLPLSALCIPSVATGFLVILTQDSSGNWSSRLTHAKILRTIWGPEYGNEPDYLRSYVKTLRKKIEDDPAPQYIVTAPWVGYRFRDPSDPDAATPSHDADDEEED